MYALAWHGDTESTWEYLRYSIVQNFGFQLFGFPFVGGDICGFGGDATEELCLRWMQLGAFYPFSRNHNSVGTRSQEPYSFGEKVAKASRNAIRQKYSYLFFYYSHLYEVSLYGGAIVTPLFFEFPEDDKAYSARNDTFLIGGGLLVAPVLYQGATEVKVYLPNENWWEAGSRLQCSAYNPREKEGITISMPASIEYVNLFFKGGSIIPYQDALSSRVRRTELLRYMPMEIIIAPNGKGNASGRLVIDDGDSVNPIQNSIYRHLFFVFSMERLTLDVNILHDYPNSFRCEKFSKLTILGAEKLSDNPDACIKVKDKFLTEIRGSYDANKKIMTYYMQNAIFNWGDITSITFKTNCIKHSQTQFFT
eukprot:TRINITY_DN3334_c0_g1_i1.p1 TRINITY_DN3334_c0_g1~~TRINITY_DN3334_c0_g1_i1.p1  ORF type:complete len:365 (+),score=44.70 TRINITY_DN3334_c0_g1_i1:363-1457(+)